MRGVVERITYANDETGYSVIKVKVKGYAERIPVVGSMASITVGTVIEVKGYWETNPKFGRQFRAESWQEKLPSSLYGIEKYLGSGLIKGIGPVFAQKIVNEFGTRTLDVLDGSPDALLDVEGIGPKRVQRIKMAWQEQKEVKNVMIFLQAHGVSTAFGSKIYKAYGSDSIAVVKENPYRLADDIFGIGFKTADALGKQLGIATDAPVRCRSGIFYVLRQLADEGHCYATAEQLRDKAAELLDIEAEKTQRTITELVRSGEIINDEEAYYLPPFFYSEEKTASRLAVIAQAPGPAFALGLTAETTTAVEYNAGQRQAIELASTVKIMILTGGPGTGKTTAIHGIISRYAAAGKKILLAAPTGRAAKRMSEATGRPAQTIHRLLEYRPPHGYKRNAEHPLRGDLLIVDETSMVDIVLMYNLLKAVPDSMVVIFVGDTDQLPSVGPGNVLGDCIASGTIPVVKLTEIFRQALGSRIVSNAHRINRGQMPELKTAGNSNFFFLAEKDNIAGTIIDLCSQRLPRFFKADPVRDIQVLTPMQRSPTGAAQLNEALQAALNKNTVCLRRGAVEYRLRDKVMQIRNNYDKEVFNGDIGFIIRIDQEEKTLTVRFDDRAVEYELTDLDQLVLAYATTIHKAQGSEYSIVVMPFSFSHYVMLQRNLLYTGITRAKNVVVLVGEKRAINYAVKNAHVRSRNTKLRERLKEKLPPWTQSRKPS